MSKTHENEKGYTDSWYALTSNRLLMTQGPLKGEASCDACVVGGGFTGLSAALELAQKGMSVILLEAKEMTAAGPGRNGGHLLRGLGRPPADLIARCGLADAKTICNATLEGLALILSRIAAHEIKCDLKFGHLTAAMNSGHLAELKREKAGWNKLGHTDMRFLQKAEARELVGSDKYTGGLFDPKGAQLHPLNYALGIAQGAQKAGCKIHDQTPAVRIVAGKSPKVVTPDGQVNAKFIILAGAIGAEGAALLKRTSVPATAYMIATSPLSDNMAKAVLPSDIAVTDARRIHDHYRLSSDKRLLFGDNRGGRAKGGMDVLLKKRMADVFPMLAATRIDHAWSSPIDFTFNGLPHVGRLSPEVYFAHGFGGHGHGIIAANILGKILAEAVSGQAARFDVFAGIKHTQLGPLKMPLFALGTLWDALRDKL